MEGTLGSREMLGLGARELAMARLRVCERKDCTEMRRFALAAAAEETGLGTLCVSKNQANKPHFTRRERRHRQGGVAGAAAFCLRGALIPAVSGGVLKSYQTSGPKLGHILLGNQFKLV